MGAGTHARCFAGRSAKRSAIVCPCSKGTGSASVSTGGHRGGVGAWRDGQGVGAGAHQLARGVGDQLRLDVRACELLAVLDVARDGAYNEGLEVVLALSLALDGEGQLGFGEAPGVRPRRADDQFVGQDSLVV